MQTIVTDGLAWSVCQSVSNVSVGLSRSWTVQKRLNWLIGCLRYGLGEESKEWRI